MHNNIMAAGSRDRPPMFATGRYAQWQSRFLRYIDTRPNGDALRECILQGPYTPTTVVIPAVPATDNTPTVPERTAVETILNMSPENKAHYESEKEAIHLLLTGIRDEIYSTVDACKTAHEMMMPMRSWASLKTRFGGNANSKKMQKAVLKQQFEAFTISSKESLEKGYDRFQKLLSQLDALGAGVSVKLKSKVLRQRPRWMENACGILIRESRMLQLPQYCILPRECKVKGSKRSRKKVKDKDAVTKNIDSWSSSSKNLWKLIDCGMSSTVKIGLGYGIQSNAEVLGYEEEISRGELGAVSDHSVNDDPIHDHIPIPSIEQVTIATQKTQPQVPKPKQTVVPSCAQHVKTPRQPIRTPVTPSPIPSNNRQNWNQRMERELGAGYSFERKTCFVCGSLSHLIKDCDYYEKKMAREAALKSQRVVHADVRQATPAWTNTNRVNKANQFTPRPVQLNNIRPNLSTASKTIKTGRVNVNTGHGNVSTVSRWHSY
ncbi:hypothetical protein Tco_0396690 [Tanacetum coccineum]